MLKCTDSKQKVNKTELYKHDFSVYYDSVDADDILDISKYLMKNVY